MLPSPVHAKYQRKTRSFVSRSPRKHILESLRQRSRITNLGLYLLVAFAAISFFLNLSHWTSLHLPNHGLQYASKLLLAFPRPITRNKINHLIMVPCHSIWKGSDSWNKDVDWLLESYQQKDKSRLNAFFQHIKKGWMRSVTFPEQKIDCITWS